MTYWFLVLGAVYIAGLVAATIRARRQTHSSDDFVTAGSDLGMLLGSLTVAATLFSTFTLLGMPDFFRNHGIGAWIFLAVADGAMIFVIIWYGFHLRRRVAEHGRFRGIAGLLRDRIGTRWASILYLAGIFIFLIPYVAIQIRGVSIFMNAIFPAAMPMWGWAAMLVAVMLVYSELGGLKAIIYADAIQGLILLSATLAVAYGCITNFGGIQAMFEQVGATNEALLSVPGPVGLFSTQFLIASFIGIIMIPVTQPQIGVRLVIMRDFSSLHRMAVFLGLFAMVIILATIPIGLSGVVNYPGATTPEFLVGVLISDPAPIIAAAVAVGLIAAAISTADSQLFALGTELQSFMTGDEKTVMRYTRIAILCFAIIALIVALLSSDQLVLLARVSFVGSALMGPLILSSVISKKAPGFFVMATTAIALLIFLSSVLGLIPGVVGSIRIDLLLLLSVGALTFVSASIQSRGELSSRPGAM